MKNLICILMLFFSALMMAQRSSIGLSGGYTTNGFGAIAEYNHHFKENSIINSSFYYSFSKDKTRGLETIYNNLTVNVGYYHKILNPRDSKFRIALGGGGLIGYEVINNGNERLDNGVGINGDSKLIYGGYIGSHVNYFISSWFALSLVLNEFYHANSDLGKFAFYGGVGIKYYVF